MQGYKFVCEGIYAILMAEDDETIMKKIFGHLEETRVGQESGGSYPVSSESPRLVARGGLWRLGEEEDEPVTFIEVWTNEVKFVPPKGAIQ
jgi:hypothetical protein